MWKKLLCTFLTARAGTIFIETGEYKSCCYNTNNTQLRPEVNLHVQWVHYLLITFEITAMNLCRVGCEQ